MAPELREKAIPRELVRDTGGFYLYEPDTSRKAYAVVPLSFRPFGAAHHFKVGDELQDVLPADVLAACLERGEASYTNPKQPKGG